MLVGLPIKKIGTYQYNFSWEVFAYSKYFGSKQHQNVEKAEKDDQN